MTAAPSLLVSRLLRLAWRSGLGLLVCAAALLPSLAFLLSPRAFVVLLFSPLFLLLEPGGVLGALREISGPPLSFALTLLLGVVGTYVVGHGAVLLGAVAALRRRPRAGQTYASYRDGFSRLAAGVSTALVGLVGALALLLLGIGIPLGRIDRLNFGVWLNVCLAATLLLAFWAWTRAWIRPRAGRLLDADPETTLDAAPSWLVRARRMRTERALQEPVDAPSVFLPMQLDAGELPIPDRVIGPSAVPTGARPAVDGAAPKPRSVDAADEKRPLPPVPGVIGPAQERIRFIAMRALVIGPLVYLAVAVATVCAVGSVSAFSDRLRIIDPSLDLDFDVGEFALVSIPTILISGVVIVGFAWLAIRIVGAIAIGIGAGGTPKSVLGVRVRVGLGAALGFMTVNLILGVLLSVVGWVATFVVALLDDAVSGADANGSGVATFAVFSFLWIVTASWFWSGAGLAGLAAAATTRFWFYGRELEDEHDVDAATECIKERQAERLAHTYVSYAPYPLYPGYPPPRAGPPPAGGRPY